MQDYTPYLDPDRGLDAAKYDTICSNVRTRCYNEHFHDENPDFIECEMCDKWYNEREEFVRWIFENYYVIPGEPSVQIDKDIIIKGNKIYSPETCIFVPHYINTFFRPEMGKQRKKSDLPMEVRETPSGKYTSSIKPWDGEKVVNLGT